MAPVDAHNSAIQEKTCLRCGRTITQNFTPISKAPTEKSVTVYNENVNEKSHSKLNIHNMYGGIINLLTYYFASPTDCLKTLVAEMTFEHRVEH